MISEWPTVSFAALGTTAIVVTSAPDALDAARSVVETVIATVDASCSRFRDDSELTAVNRAAGRTVSVSATLARCAGDGFVGGPDHRRPCRPDGR